MEECVDIHVGGYHLTEPIGTGGTGSVFKATVEANDKVAAKGSTAIFAGGPPNLPELLPVTW